jgi:hypothetical protein
MFTIDCQCYKNKILINTDSCTDSEGDIEEGDSDRQRSGGRIHHPKV